MNTRIYRAAVAQAQRCTALGRQSGGAPMSADLLQELDLAEVKAWQNLARYKFWMFGYFAGRWVFVNRISGAKRPNPFKRIVDVAKEVLSGRTPQAATA